MLPESYRDQHLPTWMDETVLINQGRVDSNYEIADQARDDVDAKDS